MYSPFVRAPGDERETCYNEGSGGLIHPTTYKVQMINLKLTLSTGSSLFQHFLKKTSYRQGYSALFCFERKEKRKGKRGVGGTRSENTLTIAQAHLRSYCKNQEKTKEQAGEKSINRITEITMLFFFSLPSPPRESFFLYSPPPSQCGQ